MFFCFILGGFGVCYYLAPTLSQLWRLCVASPQIVCEWARTCTVQPPRFCFAVGCQQVGLALVGARVSCLMSWPVTNLVQASVHGRGLMSLCCTGRHTFPLPIILPVCLVRAVLSTALQTCAAGVCGGSSLDAFAAWLSITYTHIHTSPGRPLRAWVIMLAQHASHRWLLAGHVYSGLAHSCVHCSKIVVHPVIIQQLHALHGFWFRASRERGCYVAS